jgi:sec-independent protein translocase protein TatA
MHSAVLLFLNIGTPELILILFVALLLFGGNKLPELARGLGKGIRDFKDASEGVKREIHNQINSFDEKPSAPVLRNDYNTDTTAETPSATIADATTTTTGSETVITEKKEY